MKAIKISYLETNLLARNQQRSWVTGKIQNIVAQNKLLSYDTMIISYRPNLKINVDWLFVPHEIVSLVAFIDNSWQHLNLTKLFHLQLMTLNQNSSEAIKSTWNSAGKHFFMLKKVIVCDVNQIHLSMRLVILN